MGRQALSFEFQMPYQIKIVLLATAVALLTTLTVGAKAMASENPVLVTAPVSKVFVPLGFDDNDDVEVVVHGHFPNTCYKTGPAKATVNEEAKTVTIQVQAFFYQQGICAQLMVPFTQPVKIGPMTAGNYQVSVIDSPQVESTLIVARAVSPNPDDHLYAPVQSVSLALNDSGQKVLTLEGDFPYMFIGCMVMDQVNVVSTPGEVLVVQPIARLTDGQECEAQADNKAFVHKQIVAEPLAEPEYLLHVRTLNGMSVNRLVNF
jgi:hypothetical protein